MKAKKIHLIYFSSNKHFNYLLISLKSLLKLNSELVGNIYLYIDEDDFLDTKQIEKLGNLKTLFEIRKTRHIRRMGKNLILSELKAFDEVSKEIDNSDYIAKTDSDIIFLNQNIFDTVVKSDDVLIGFEEKISSYSFTQGGLYFIKSSFIKEILNFDESLLNDVSSLVIQEKSGRNFVFNDDYPEDLTIFMMIKNKTDKIRFISFMEIPTIYNTKNPSVIHFLGTKDAMIYYVYLGRFGLNFYLLMSLFIGPYDCRNRLMGRFGIFLRSHSQLIYRFLKPYFPNKE